MAVIDFGGKKETVVMRKEFPMSRARRVLKKETIAIIGYGVQGPAQALNLKDNGFNVIIGQSKAFRKDWNRAKKDGWVPGKTLSTSKKRPVGARSYSFSSATPPSGSSGRS